MASGSDASSVDSSEWDSVPGFGIDSVCSLAKAHCLVSGSVIDSVSDLARRYDAGSEHGLALYSETDSEVLGLAVG